MMDALSVSDVIDADGTCAVAVVVADSVFEHVPLFRVNKIRLRCTTGFTSFFVNINDVLFCLTRVIDLFGLNCMSGVRSKFVVDLSQSTLIFAVEAVVLRNDNTFNPGQIFKVMFDDR